MQDGGRRHPVLVAELVQEPFQKIGTSVDVTDDVIANHAPSVSRPKQAAEGCA